MDLENVVLSFEEILQEVQMMRFCNDPNILTLHTNFVHKESLWLITQLMNKGSCLRVMNMSKFLSLGEGFSEDCLSFILCETLKGLNYLHSRGLIHRDIKSGNILLDSTGAVKLSDLAFSGWTLDVGQRTQQKAKTVVGTPSFMAPEVMEQISGYDHRADIWSLGITALELAKGYPPYASLAPMRILQLTLDSEPPSLKTYPYENQCHANGQLFSKYFEDFYKKCLQKNPKHRPSAAELLKHRLVRNVAATPLIQLLDKIPFIDDVSVKAVHDFSIHVNAGGDTKATDDFYSDLMTENEFASESRGVEENSKTPSRHNSSRRYQFDDDGSNRLVDADAADPPAQLREVSFEDQHQRSASPRDDENAEESSSASYVPGTTWVFDTRGANSSSERQEQLQAQLEKLNVNQPPPPPQDHQRQQEDDINDFLEEFDSQEATLKS